MADNGWMHLKERAFTPEEYARWAELWGDPEYMDLFIMLDNNSDVILDGEWFGNTVDENGDVQATPGHFGLPKNLRPAKSDDEIEIKKVINFQIRHLREICGWFSVFAWPDRTDSAKERNPVWVYGPFAVKDGALDINGHSVDSDIWADYARQNGLSTPEFIARLAFKDVLNPEIKCERRER